MTDIAQLNLCQIVQAPCALDSGIESTSNFDAELIDDKHERVELECRGSALCSLRLGKVGFRVARPQGMRSLQLSLPEFSNLSRTSSNFI
jgi:hypothetical protein